MPVDPQDTAPQKQQLTEAFQSFLSSMVLVEETTTLPVLDKTDVGEPLTHTSRTMRQPGTRWWFNPTPGFDDFNLELCPPGVIPDLPDGAIGVRTDDDFWVDAVLPWRFRKLGIQTIVATLWPGLKNPVFHPTTGYLKSRWIEQITAWHEQQAAILQASSNADDLERSEMHETTAKMLMALNSRNN